MNPPLCRGVTSSRWGGRERQRGDRWYRYSVYGGVTFTREKFSVEVGVESAFRAALTPHQLTTPPTLTRAPMGIQVAKFV